MDLLKSYTIHKRCTYQAAVKALGLGELFQKFLNTGNRFFDVKVDGGKAKFTPKTSSFDRLAALQFLKTLLKAEDVVNLKAVLESKHEFALRHRNVILLVGFFDLWLAWNTAKAEEVCNPSLINYLLFHAPRKRLHESLKKRRPESARSNIHISNQDSSVLDLKNPKQNRRTLKISKTNQDIIASVPGLSFIEIDKDVSQEKLTTFLAALKSTMDKVSSYLAAQGLFLEDQIKFGLRLRKIKHTHKRGIYLPAENVIVLDPRHSESMVHEVGHWYHTHFRKDIVDSRKAEIFADGFEMMLNQFSI